MQRSFASKLGGQFATESHGQFLRNIQISTEYIDSVVGKNKFADSNKGKLLRTLGMYGIGTGIGALLGGPLGGLAGAGIIKTVTELGLGLFDTFTLDSILKGWNPRMFTDEITKLKEAKE